MRLYTHKENEGTVAVIPFFPPLSSSLSSLDIFLLQLNKLLCKSFPSQTACSLPQLKGSSLISLKKNNILSPLRRIASSSEAQGISLAASFILKLKEYSLKTLQTGHTPQSFFFSPAVSPSKYLQRPSPRPPPCSCQPPLPPHAAGNLPITEDTLP